MASFDVFALVELLRQLTIDNLEPLRAKGLQLPDLPDMITTDDRFYETNLRALLRYLKHVNKACKRQDPDSCQNVLVFRSVIKQWHDVDEWATETLLSLDTPEGLSGTEHNFTPSELREFLNAPITSRSACGPDSNATDFNFNGNCREDCADASQDHFHFRFRCTSDPAPHTVETSTASHNPLTPVQVFGSAAESLSAPRRVSAPVSAQDASAQCFLGLSGETLEQFIAGVEVEESKLDNKKRWLLELRSLTSSWFLGRWPSRTKLREFMEKHNLDWPVRISGKWDLTPKSFGEREAIKNKVLEELFPKDTVCAAASSDKEEVMEVDSNDTLGATVIDDFVFGIKSPPVPAAGHEAEQDAIEVSKAIGMPAEIDMQKEFSPPKVDMQEEFSPSDVRDKAASVDTTEAFSAPGELDVLGIIHTQEEPPVRVGVELHRASDNLSHVFVWVKDGGFARSSSAEEKAEVAEELERRCTYENLSHIFVWLGSCEFALGSDAQEEPGDENFGVGNLHNPTDAGDAEDIDTQDDQMEKAVAEEVPDSSPTSTGPSADVEDCDLSTQDVESATDIREPAEEKQLHTPEVNFTACDDSTTTYDVDCAMPQAEILSTIQPSIDNTDDAGLPNELEHEISEESSVDDDGSLFDHNTDGETSSLETIVDETEEAEITKKVIPASEGLNPSDFDSKLKVLEESSLQTPRIVLTLPDGTEVDIETVPWERRRRGKQTVNDPSRLAPPPRPKQSSNRDRSLGSRCSLRGCDKCTKFSSETSEVKAEKEHSVNNAKESEEGTEKMSESKTLQENQEKPEKQALEESMECCEWDTESIAELAKQAEDWLSAKRESAELGTAKTVDEGMPKVADKHEGETETPAEAPDKSAPLSLSPPSANIEEFPTTAIEHNATAPTWSAIGEEESTYTPPSWSVAPVLAGMGLSALYMSARCPLLPALGIVVGSVYLKNKLSRG
ncbi:hypothetical protein H2200_001328 [Cladophialophora chaetospira]|uniref:Uncharacterized protein n=1 Tax=Cladophialophora chaetospira TaxID=386627 RepID=A0AA38XKN1_9EURO|nr:hypothetical protein H2200_001328 [Cladophialophora chaetospira]